MKNEYYVYAYLREDGTPYYIGKGKGNRITAKHNVPVPKNCTNIIKIHEELTEEFAHEMEILFIATYGRKNNNTGILRNLTDGGEGSSGHTFIPSEEWKEDRRQLMSGDKNPMKNSEISSKFKGDNNNARTQSARDKLRGDKNPAKRTEVRNAISDALTGIPKPHMRGDNNPMRDPKIAEKMSGDNHFSKRENYEWPTKKCEHCQRTFSIGMFNRWHGDNCKSFVQNS
jgi:hypothetical protein